MAGVTTQGKRLGSGKLYSGGVGGTALGAVKQAHIAWGAFIPLLAEEINGTWEVLHLGDQARLTCVLVGWDADALSAICPNYSASAVLWPGSTIPAGTPVSPIANLVFVPDVAAQHAVKFFSAAAEIRRVGDGVALAGRGYSELTAIFHGLPNASDNVGALAPVASLP